SFNLDRRQYLFKLFPSRFQPVWQHECCSKFLWCFVDGESRWICSNLKQCTAGFLKVNGFKIIAIFAFGWFQVLRFQKFLPLSEFGFIFCPPCNMVDDSSTRKTAYRRG